MGKDNLCALDQVMICTMKKSGRAFWLLAANMICIFGSFGYLIADNQPPYTYYPDESYVKPSTTYPGHQVEVYWKLKVNRVCRGTAVRIIVDERTGARFSYDPTAATATIKLGDDHLRRTFLLPDGISPGKKMYRAEGEYVCNILQRFFPLKVVTPELQFEVLPKDQ